jgi:hypothetical protein
MGAIKSKSAWGWWIAAALFTLSNSGCMITDSYSFRPGHWFVHNLFPSTCKTCPGGMPGPDGCRTFKDPWCAGYQNTMWRDLGTDCGPSRMPSALAFADQGQPTLSSEAATETQPGDQAPALPESFPSPLPNNTGQAPTPLPELPLDGTLPEDDPFPVKPVPSTPENPQDSPLGVPDDGPPQASPDLFPETKPGSGKLPAPKTPLAVPENIDDLFTPPSTEAPNSKVPSTLPPEKSPAKPLPNKTEPTTSPKKAETLPEPGNTPAPKTSKPELPFEDTPSLEDSPDLFPESNKKPDPKEKGKEKQPEPPKLFEDSSYQELNRVPESHASVKFGTILPVSAVNDTVLRVQPAGGTIELQQGQYQPGVNPSSPAQPSLRILQQ